MSTGLFRDAGPLQLLSTFRNPARGRRRRSNIQATIANASHPAMTRRKRLFQNAGMAQRTPTNNKKKKRRLKANPKRPAGRQVALTDPGVKVVPRLMLVLPMPGLPQDSDSFRSPVLLGSSLT